MKKAFSTKMLNNTTKGAQAPIVSARLQFYKIGVRPAQISVNKQLTY